MKPRSIDLSQLQTRHGRDNELGWKGSSVGIKLVQDMEREKTGRRDRLTRCCRGLVLGRATPSDSEAVQARQQRDEL